jgi:8-oxo-dGTP diphosphatase
MASRRSAAPAKPPKGYDASRYPSFAVTVDIVILTMADGHLHVLLVQRDADPYAGAWALPGGFKQPDETLDEAAARELAEETGVTAAGHLAQFGAYGDPGRDQRTNVVTVAYLAVVPDVGAIAAGSDAADAQLWPVDRIRSGDVELAFDHDRIVHDALDRVARDLESTGLAPSFLPATFTLTELQQVYEAVWDETLDTPNFRRSLTADPALVFVEPTGERAASSPRGGRPPELFRAGPAWHHASPVRRTRRR